MYGVVLHAHPVRGESHNRRNTTGEVATPPKFGLATPMAETDRLITGKRPWPTQNKNLKKDGESGFRKPTYP